MSMVDPKEAVGLIQIKAGEFAVGDAEDPKVPVDAVMADIEATLGKLGGGAATYLDEVDGQVKTLLDPPSGTTGGADDSRDQRRMRFLRSIAQLIEARRAVGIQDLK